MQQALTRRHRLLSCAIAVAIASALPLALAPATPLVKDPKGFEGIPWGASFSETADFVLVENGPRMKGYELKQGPPLLGPAKIDTMRFLTIDGQFARVTIRYHSIDTHRQIVAYLQSTYGPVDLTPGQITRGAVQQFNWRGDDTQILLTYEASTDRGIIFFENPTLASKIEAGMAPDPDLGGATY